MNDPDGPRRHEPVPDPHAAEAPPPIQEGMRPEADPNLSWPGMTEPGGPVGGLVEAAGAETAAHYTHSPAAAAIADAAGVEEEGLESGQLFGLMLATAVAIIVLVIAVYYLFYSPVLQESRRTAADVPVDRYVELNDTRTAASWLMGAYGANDDGTYRVPIDEAMGMVARDYAATAPAAGDTAAAAGFVSPANNGLSWLTLTPPPAVRALDGASPAGAPAPAGATEATPAGTPAADSL